MTRSERSGGVVRSARPLVVGLLMAGFAVCEFTIPLLSLLSVGTVVESLPGSRRAAICQLPSGNRVKASMFVDHPAGIPVSLVKEPLVGWREKRPLDEERKLQRLRFFAGFFALAISSAMIWAAFSARRRGGKQLA